MNLNLKIYPAVSDNRDPIIRFAAVSFRSFTLILGLLVSGICNAGIKDTTAYTPALVMQVGVGYNHGTADLGKRFPWFSTLPAGVYLRTKHNFNWGFNYNRFLGNRFQLDSLFGGIVGPSQQVLDKNGNVAVIRYYMRGYSAQLYFGKALKVFPKAKYGRLQVTMGAGILQHRIKMRFDKGLLPQLEGDYADGYDRLCNGFMLTQTVNYQYYNVGSLSFFAGFNFTQSFTQNQRNWDYGTMRHDSRNRHDNYIGISAGILIPVPFRSVQSKDYYD